MTNVYIDPFSPEYLSDKLFTRDKVNDQDQRLFVWPYLRDYCLEKDISLHTVDLQKKERESQQDVYISLDHKGFLKKLYWRLKNKKYPFTKLNAFKKRILFHIEPSTVTPEVYLNINGLFRKYDEVYFSCKVGIPKCRYFKIPRPYSAVSLQYWQNSHRKFLVMIQINKRTRWHRRLIMWANRKSLPFQKDLLGERIKIIEFFSRSRDIDLYGLDWDKRLPLPYYFYKNAVKKVYKGKVPDKLEKLSEYTFAIAMENNITPGFIGEIIFECFYVGTIPVYLGAPDIKEYIPKECFIDMRDFKNYEELREFLKSLPESQIQQYKENGRSFLQSEKYKPFTKEHFAKLFVEVCLG